MINLVCQSAYEETQHPVNWLLNTMQYTAKIQKRKKSIFLLGLKHIQQRCSLSCVRITSLSPSRQFICSSHLPTLIPWTQDKSVIKYKHLLHKDLLDFPVNRARRQSSHISMLYFISHLFHVNMPQKKNDVPTTSIPENSRQTRSTDSS